MHTVQQIPPLIKHITQFYTILLFFFLFTFGSSRKVKTRWVRLAIWPENMFQAFWRCTDGDQGDENLYKTDWASQFIDSNSTITNGSLDLS